MVSLGETKVDDSSSKEPPTPNRSQWLGLGDLLCVRPQTVNHPMTEEPEERPKEHSMLTEKVAFS